MDKEIVIKLHVVENFNISEEFLMDIINGLNDRYVPVETIEVDGKLRFSNTEGFIKEVEK